MDREVSSLQSTNGTSKERSPLYDYQTFTINQEGGSICDIR
jgi:hypothetical protein